MTDTEVESMQERIRRGLDSVRTSKDRALRAFQMGKVVAEADILHRLKVMSEDRYRTITKLCGEVLYGN